MTLTILGLARPVSAGRYDARMRLEAAQPRLPITGVNGVADLAQRLDALHEMLYTRGGIRPVNAALEELSKLLLLTIAARRHPSLIVSSFGELSEVIAPSVVRSAPGVEAVKAAFTLVVGLDDMVGTLPGGQAQSVWPLDEPLRVARTDVLAEALEILGSLDATPTKGHPLDPLGTAFDVFLHGRYDHAGGLGSYLTPEPVATAMAEIALELIDLRQNREGPIFCDPCCGTGRFLVAIIEAMRKRHPSDERVDDFARTGVLGADQSTSAVAKARVNLLAYGLSRPQVFSLEDSVVDRNLDQLTGTLDLILTNPPFGEGKYDSREGIRRTSRFVPLLSGRRRIDPALAFVSRCLDLLRPGGVLGIVLPDGVVEGAAMRRALQSAEVTHDFEVEAVISLPRPTFELAGTAAKTSVLFVRRGGSSRGTVFLARAEHIGYLKQGTSAVADPLGNDMPGITRHAEVLSAIETNPKTRIICQDPLVALVRRGELPSLNPNNFDPRALAARKELQKAGAISLSQLLRPVKGRREAAPGGASFISVLHVDGLSTVDWEAARTYAPSTPGILACPGEIVVSLINPSKLRATVIPEGQGVVQCSAEFGVFATDEDPFGVLSLLHDPRVRAQLFPLGRGTSSSRRRIEAEDLTGLLVPNMTSKQLRAKGIRLRSAIEGLDAARGSLVRLLDTN